MLAFPRGHRWGGPSLSLCLLVPSQNAMRATVESHESSLVLPPIKVMVALGEEDLSIKVGDPCPRDGEEDGLGERRGSGGVLTQPLSPR